MGQELALPFIAMTHWGDKWVGDGEKPLVLRSKVNGQALSVALVDERGKPVKRSDVEAVIDPVYATRSDKD